MDEEEYLQADWDPRSAKVAQLRGILLKHDVPYPANAKKADLVRLFDERVRPQSEALLAQMQTIRPSQSGILDGASQDGSLKEIDTDEEELERRKKRRKSRKSFARMDIDKEPAAAQAPQRDDTDMQNTPHGNVSPRKRKSSARLSDEKSPKAAKHDEPLPPRSNRSVSAKYESGGESGFSDFNPFQSPGNTSPESKAKRRKSSIGPARRSSLAPPTPKAAGRKSTPAGLGSARSQVVDDDEEASRPTPGRSRFSHVEIGLSSSPPPKDKSVGPEQQQRTASSTIGTPGVKYMAPLSSIKRTPPELTQMRQRLASFEHETAAEDLSAADGSGDIADTSMNDVDTTPPRFDSLGVQSPRSSSHRPLSPKPEPISPRPLSPKPALASSPRRSIIRKQPSIRWSDSPVPEHERAVSTLARTPAPKKQPRDLMSMRHDVPVHADIAKSSWSDRAQAMFTGTMTILVILFMFAWREEKIAAGFCDVGTQSNARIQHRSGFLSLPAVPEPPPAVAGVIDTLHVRPTCTPCPNHGSCVEGIFLGCAPEYIAKAHPLSLGGLIPLAPRCKPDTEKIMAVALQASRAAKLLRRRRGEVICEGLEKTRRKQENDEAFVFGLAEEQLMKALAAESEAKGTVFKQQSLDELGRLALTDLMNHNEVTMSQVGSERWFATHAAEMPLTCRARLAAIRSAQKNKRSISSILAAIAALFWARARVREYRDQQKRVRELVQTSLKKLREQERYHHIDPALTPTSAIAPTHLRDLVLEHEHSPARRKQLWNRVARVVEGNSNVRTTQVEMNGEDVRAWEWTGAAGWIPDDVQSQGLEQQSSRPGTPLYPKLTDVGS